MENRTTIGVIFITHRAKHHLPFCLPPILKSPLKPKVLVVNSSSGDGTVELAQQMGAETLIIPRSEFNHGATREIARRHLNTDIVVMMTPDAYAIDECMLSHLVEPLIRKEASVAYARQLPHQDADFFAAFAREFNYPAEGHLRSLEDRSFYGVYTIFCSNSCAAYRNKALDEIGGFTPVLTGEDTIAVAKLLKAGHSIAYVGEAQVRHSHNYSLKEEFKRHFDTGLARRKHQEWISIAGTDDARGKKYAKELLKRLSKKPFWFSYALLQLAAKWSGYKLGRMSHNAPTWFKKIFSSQEFYWKSTHSE